MHTVTLITILFFFKTSNLTPFQNFSFCGDGTTFLRNTAGEEVKYLQGVRRCYSKSTDLLTKDTEVGSSTMTSALALRSPLGITSGDTTMFPNPFVQFLNGSLGTALPLGIYFILLTLPWVALQPR